MWSFDLNSFVQDSCVDVGVFIYTFVMTQGFSLTLMLQIGVLETPRGGFRFPFVLYMKI